MKSFWNVNYVRHKIHAVLDILEDHSAIETSGTTHSVTQHHIPEDLTFSKGIWKSYGVAQISA
jgi:hypothetical protein